MTRLNKEDRLFIKRLTQKVSKAISKLENSVPEISLSHGILNLYNERIKEPEIFKPAREQNLKDETTPLPADNLQTKIRDLSIRSLIAWQLWVEPKSGPFKLSNDDTEYHPLSEEDVIRSVETGKVIGVKILLESDEADSLAQYKKDVEESEQRWREEEEAAFKHISTVVPTFHGCEIGLIKRDVYSRTYPDYLESVIRSDFETNKWRKPAKDEDRHLMSNCGFRDDPDFIPPSSGSGNFNTIPPAKRMYNAIFKVYLKDSSITDTLHPDKNVAKDYTDIEDVLFLYDQKKIKVENVLVEYCRFEIDLRVTYSDTPDPKNYKKVDTQSPAGLKLMVLLNEQPSLWKEHSWEYEIGGQTVKKVAFGLTFGAKEQNKATYWVYLDERYIKGKNIIFNRKPQPHIAYEGRKDTEGKCHLFIANLTYHTSNRGVRVSQSYKDEHPDSADYVVENLVNKLTGEGFLKAKSSEDTLGLVTEMYIHKDAITRKARDKLVLTEDQWNSKYGSSVS